MNNFTIEMLFSLITKDKDVIISEFINRLKNDYENVSEQDDNPYTSFYDMLDTEFLCMGADHHDYTRDILQDILTALWGGEFYEFCNNFILDNQNDYYDLSSLVYANYIDSVLVDLVNNMGAIK